MNGAKKRTAPKGRPGTLLLGCVFFTETLDTTSRIDKLLLASEERMARGADLRGNFTHSRRASLKGVATVAFDRCVVVLGVDTFFHISSPGWSGFVQTRNSGMSAKGLN